MRRSLISLLTLVAFLVLSVVAAFCFQKDAREIAFSTEIKPGVSGRVITFDKSGDGGCRCVQLIKTRRVFPATTAVGVILANQTVVKTHDTITLKWAVSGATEVEVRVGRPDGDLFARTPAAEWETDDWLSDGLTFFLQDVSDGRPLIAENTISTVTITKKE